MWQQWQWKLLLLLLLLVGQGPPARDCGSPSIIELCPDSPLFCRRSFPRDRPCLARDGPFTSSYPRVISAKYGPEGIARWCQTCFTGCATTKGASNSQAFTSAPSWPSCSRIFEELFHNGCSRLRTLFSFSAERSVHGPHGFSCIKSRAFLRKKRTSRDYRRFCGTTEYVSFDRSWQLLSNRVSSSFLHAHTDQGTPEARASDANAARKAAKSSNTFGNPIRLPSKILAVVSDPSGRPGVYVAESAGTLRRIDIETKEFKTEVYRGPAAPLTSLCILNDTIFAGCWDKSVWAWPLHSSGVTSKDPKRFHGHTDFVKSVTCTTLESKHLLISGAQDAKIIVWDVLSTTKLHVLSGHARGILSLAILPLPPSSAAHAYIDLFSGGSEGQIRRWRVSSTKAGPLHESLDAQEATELRGSQDKEIDVISVHETSVNALHFSAPDPDVAEDDATAMLHTASSDKSSKVLRSNHASTCAAYRKASSAMEHPDFVRAVTPLSAPDSELIATACRDEGVRIWDTESGELLHCFEGHFEEVTGLAIVGDRLVSVSIDGTIRCWPATRKGIEEAAVEETERKKKEDAGVTAAEEKTGVQLDEGEEAELAALMEDD
ncbi:hypothetical protein FH972_026054 [Carpinus fangiana]|uniref:Uncharacterized protein n=1 Tax=Carpinus fangiana TaxID=176857 RepID=A0A5N6L2W7_9ROSI|nr:hypothetical protein FH972_026054 [Carpinus fangiana]